MRRLQWFALLAGVILCGFATRASAVDIGSIINSDRPVDNFGLIQVSALVSLMHSGKTFWLYDANANATREKYGIIPGAKLLSSDDHYDVASELPRDKNAKLVFYCANQH
ncbi:MAG TPA: hypothetical protein VEF03_01780 [Candidatus Binataceae bacterium]|nr:hypothetical protein [Candidatus Binataceae bacterium]